MHTANHTLVPSRTPRLGVDARPASDGADPRADDPSSAVAGRLLAVAAVALAVVLAWSGSAFGATQYGPATQFGLGQAVGPNPVGLAVNTSTSGSDPSAGDVYVTGGSVVNRFTAASAAAGNAAPDGQLTGFTYAYGIAVDPSNGDVFVADYFQAGGLAVWKFDNTGASVAFALDPLVAGSIANPGGVAINPVDHHVFVGEASTGVIYELDASGTYTNNSYQAPAGVSGLAIDASPEATVGDGAADVYAATGPGGNGVVKFTSPVSGPVPFAAGNAGGVAVAPDTQHVYVSGGNTAAAYDPNGTQVGPALGAGVLNDSYGIGSDADGGHLYIADNPSNSAFALTRGIVADVTTGDASDIEATTATLNGHVDPDGGPPATCTFAYGTDPALAGADTVSCAGGPNATPADVSAQLSGLRPAQTYYFRLVSTNGFDGSRGEIKSFSTASAAPAAVTGEAADVTTGHATLRGALNPYGLQTSYHFEYGTTASYGSRVPAGVELVAGNGRAERHVGRGITGLQPATIYHYRLVATNSLGTTTGDDHTFTTDAASGPVRGYEMVSPLDNAGVSVDSFPDGVKVREDGNAVAYLLNKESYPDAQATTIIPRVLGIRNGDGWSNQSLDVPTANLTYPFPINLFHTVVATSEDLSRSLVFSPRKLGEQGVEGNGNLYLYDQQTKHYTLVASSSDLLLFGREFADTNGSRIYVGGSTNLDTIVFMSLANLTPDAVGGGTKFYLWSASRGLRFLCNSERASIDFSLPQAHQVSPTGDRVYVDDDGSNTGVASLYEDGQLRPISVDHRAGRPHVTVPGRFAGASPDGRYALVISGGLLTDDAVNVLSGDELLYRYDAESGGLKFLAGGLSGDLGRVLSTPTNAGDGVYFSSIFPQAGASGSSRLYIYAVGPTGPEFIASRGSIVDDGPSYTSPSRRYLAFESAARLTSVDNKGQVEVYLYDAATKQLACPSCRSDGKSSTGRASIGQDSPAAGSQWQRHFARSVTDEGQVFFDTPDPLVAADVNGVRDVYAYQDGRVSLISRGKVGREATFLDATSSGSDVFFVTGDRLVGQDDNVTADLYDARIGGGIAAQSAKGARAACGGPECREPDVGASGSPPTASERVDAASGKAGARAKARVSVVKTSFTSKALRLTVSVSGRGRIRVAGAGVVASGRSVARAGRFTLRVPLTGRVRAARRAGRRVRVVVRVSLAPPFGAPGSLKLTRTLGR